MIQVIQVQEQRAELTRNYPAQEVPYGGRSSEVRAGEGDIQGIRGWILTFGYIDEPSQDQQLAGYLTLRYPMLGNVNHRVEGFDAGTGGAFFIPWPFVAFSVQDVNDRPLPDEGVCSQLVATFVPVLPLDPAPPGLGSVLYGRERVAISSQGTELTVPKGATEYRVLPADSLQQETHFTLYEKTGVVTWARYTIDPHEPLASGSALGRCAWQTTPPEPAAKLLLEHNDEGEQHATVYWRYDLGQSR